MNKKDRKGVVEGFEPLKTEDGRKLAITVEQRGVMKNAKAALSSAT
jgi:hypothetical protein